VQSIYKFYFLLSFVFFSGLLLANESKKDELGHCLKLNKDGIKVYTFRHKGSDFTTFKASTYINASLDSILAVIFDNKACTEWVYACDDAFMIKSISFNERYHYQVSNIPFPFVDRDFIFHSIMKQNPLTKAVIISMASAADFCQNKSSNPCKKVNQSQLVRVKKTIGTYKLEPDDKGTKITWIQHTNLAGKLPKWLINQFVTETPYRSFKNLAEKVKEQQYHSAQLIYGNQGVAIALNIPPVITKEPVKSAKDFPQFPTF